MVVKWEPNLAFDQMVVLESRIRHQWSFVPIDLLFIMKQYIYNVIFFYIDLIFFIYLPIL